MVRQQPNSETRAEWMSRLFKKKKKKRLLGCETREMVLGRRSEGFQIKSVHDQHTDTRTHTCKHDPLKPRTRLPK